MSDSSEKVEMAFEPGDESDVEVIALKEGETLPPPEEEKKEEPEKVQLSKEEFQALISGRDSGATLAAGLEKLGEKLAPQPQYPGPMPVPQADEDLESEAFKPGQFKKVVSKIVEQTQAASLSQISRIAQEQEKKILRLDPDTSEIYKKYEKEIEARVAGLPPNMRFAPDIYGQAYRVITQEKMGEIIEMKATERATKIAEEAVAKALEAAGIKPKAAAGSQAVYSEATGGAPPKPKTRLVITQADRQDMIESAMDPTDPDQVKSYLRWKQSKGVK